MSFSVSLNLRKLSLYETKNSNKISSQCRRWFTTICFFFLDRSFVLLKEYSITGDYFYPQYDLHVLLFQRIDCSFLITKQQRRLGWWEPELGIHELWPKDKPSHVPANLRSCRKEHRHCCDVSDDSFDGLEEVCKDRNIGNSNTI